MTSNKPLIYILLFILLPFQFCANAPKKSETAVSEELTVSQDSVEAIEAESYKLTFDKILKKPILNFFRANIEENPVFVIECSVLSAEILSTDVYTAVIANNPFLYEDVNQEHVNVVDYNGHKHLNFEEANYELSEIVDATFDSYSSLNYMVTAINSTDVLEEDAYWNDTILNYEYNQSFVPIRKTDLYKKVFDSSDFLDITLGTERTDISQWKHTISYDTQDSDEPRFDSWYVTRVAPIYFDSTVFVILKTEEVYMGGAHGMYYTKDYNFDVKTGKLIEFTDIIDVNSHQFNTLMETKVKDIYEADLGEDHPSSFMIYPDGINLTFPAYSLGGGSWEKDIFFTYNELGDMLKRELYPYEKER